MRRVLSATQAGEPVALRPWRELRGQIHAHHKAYVEGAVAGVLTVAALSLSGSAGFVQQIVADPVKRTVRMAGGDFGPKGFAQITTGMSRHAVDVARTVSLDGQPWRPAGVAGWAVYDLAHPPTLVRSNLSFDEARVFNSLIMPATGEIATLKPFVLPARASVEGERALLCLTQGVYYEAGFETGEGQQAVAQVILNRLRHPAYPKSVCGVVYQGSQRMTGCQFSFTCDGSLARVPGEEAWARSRDVARRALAGFVYKPVGTSTHYHADYVFPYWAVTLVKLRKIGAHIFYRMTGPSGSPSGFNGRYAGGETVLDPSILTGGDELTPDAPSAVVQPAQATPADAPQTVTLTVGGETRTYVIGAAGAGPMPDAVPVAPVAGADGAMPLVPPITGTLTPVRRAPTPDEVKRVNEALQKFEEDQKPAPPAAEAPKPAPRPAPPRAPAREPMRPLGSGSF